MKKRRFKYHTLSGDIYAALMVCRYTINNKRRLHGKKPIRRRNIKKTYGIVSNATYYTTHRLPGYGVTTLYYRE